MFLQVALEYVAVIVWFGMCVLKFKLLKMFVIRILIEMSWAVGYIRLGNILDKFILKMKS